MMTIGRRLWNYNSKEIGVILFDIYPEKLIKLSKEFFDLGIANDIQLFITDKEGKIIYDSKAITGKIAWEFDKKIEFSNEIENKPDLLVISAFSSSGKLLAGIEIPKNKLSSKVGIFLFIIFLVDMTLFIVIIFLAARQSFKIDLPIRKLRQNMLRARLSSLQGQINPHMLYNTLESIRMKAVVNNQNQIAEMIKVLARMFKHSLHFDEQDNFVLNELRYAKDYLYMQNIRYDNNFMLEEHLSSSVLNIPIIPMVFQPLIENCVKHGFRGPSSRLHIVIKEDILSASVVKISITDNGKGAPEEKIKEINATKNGIGLRNLSERLRLRYGENSALKISSQEGLWFKVEFILPLDNDILNNNLYNGSGE
jgi:two-component system sensor histidine kinase YesM